MTDPSNTIVLAGSGRSGTTWLGNIITAGWSFRIIFEPFDPRHVPQAKAAGMSLRPYCSPDEACPVLFEFTKKALSGRLHNRWVDQPVVRLQRFYRFGKFWFHDLWLYRFWAWRLMLKTVRATLLLAWIDKNFNSPIVYIIRHPGAVVASRCKLNWETHLDMFLAQPNLMQDYLSPYEDIINFVKTDVQKHTVTWCIENLLPLAQLKQHNWVFCTYENILINPEAETHRILASLNLKFTSAHEKAIYKMSHVTSIKSSLRYGQDVLTEWQGYFSKKELADMSSIVREFGYTIYDFNEPLPNQKEYLRLLKLE